MGRKANWKRYVSVLIAFALVLGSIVGAGKQNAEAAAGKTIRSVKILQAGKNVTKKTLNMKKGSSKKLTIKARQALSKKNIKYKSSNEKVVSVNKNGKLQAKKYGSARITVTVSKKGYKTKKTWMKVSVKKSDKVPATTQSPAPTMPTTTPNVTETPSPTGTPDETETPSETPNSTVAPTATPDATPTPDVPENPDSSGEEGIILVAYFSWSGTSERIAQNIINQTGADSFRIERETPYSDDYNTVAYGEAQTEAETNARPPLKEPLASVEQYDKIVLCYPIWWHTAPMTVGTFLESYDFTGKTMYPVSQSASMNTSQYDQSVAFVKECAKGATVDDGIFSKNNDDISKYIESTVLKQ